MLYSKEQIVNGMASYIDEEVIPKLPTSGKWIVGTVTGLALGNIDSFLDNNALCMLGVRNENGLYDVDKLMECLKHNASRYGNITIKFPFVGTMSFGEKDLDEMKRRII